MKRTLLVGVALFVAIFASACGDNRNNVVDIVSEGGAFDGDITTDDGVNYTVITSDQFPFTVVVDFQPGFFETRGFVTFSLAPVPLAASIRSATVFLPVLDVTPLPGNASVRLLPDMVEFDRLDTLTTNTARGFVFDTTEILFLPDFAVFLGDEGLDVAFDVTDAVIEANIRALPTLQIRLTSDGGRVEIDDLFDPGAGGRTPLLRVEYF